MQVLKLRQNVLTVRITKEYLCCAILYNGHASLNMSCNRIAERAGGKERWLVLFSQNLTVKMRV
jgi:hypothetical protein